MLNRRELLLAASAASLMPVMGAVAEPSKTASSEEASKMNALFDIFVDEQLERSPETATSLGIDNGKRVGLKSRLSDVSLAATAKETADNASRIARLKAIDRTALTGLDAASYDTIMFTMAVEDEGNRSFDYGGGGSGAPYILSQLTGSYQSIPDFLDTEHAIDTKDDAEAYLSRLDGFATMMDQELEQARHDVGVGVIPPDFVIDKTLIQMKAFLDTPADQAILVRSVDRRAKEKNIAGDWHGRASALYTGKVLPALARQAAYLAALRPKAVHDAGVAHLPKGADYYRVSLKNYTTSDMAPEEIHRIGLDLVKSLSAELDPLLKARGFTDGTVGSRLKAIASDPRYLYPNTDAGKDKMLADLNAKVAVVQAKLPGYFAHLPKSTVEIRRVPKNTEAGAPGGYYQPGSLDGSRAGAYYINLRDTAELPSWGLSTLTYHEAIPGHHLQISLSNETAGLPLIRKMLFFSGYGEGWALYAEQLAIEMGLYDDDALGRIGQLQAALFRAVRLVVDSGMHAKGWSREKAVAFYVDTLGEKESAAITEIERYCVWPGQACSYMLGKLVWLKARQKAKQALGARFDLKAFHDAGLLSGALPLTVLATVIDNYVASVKA
jgi:uncharacterized protein (DUF885 family)